MRGRNAGPAQSMYKSRPPLPIHPPARPTNLTHSPLSPPPSPAPSRPLLPPSRPLPPPRVSVTTTTV